MSKEATIRSIGRRPAKCADHRPSKTADADEYDVLPAGPVEEAADAFQALVDLIAAIRAAGVADGHEVAPHLGGRDAGEAGELMGVDVGRPGAVQVVEQARVRDSFGRRSFWISCCTSPWADGPMGSRRLNT